MSRIGKQPISIPSGVTVTLDGQKVTAKGAKGELSRDIRPEIEVKQEESEIVLSPRDESAQSGAYWGLSRTLIANMIEGVSKGYEKELTIKGVGYKATLKGKDLDLSLGYSHPIVYKAPDGITFEVDPKKNTIKVSGINKEVVGQTAAEIRSFRKPEPYKGKGVAYTGERILRKAGKTAGK